MGMFGKLFHFGVDAVLVSAVLAGVRRSTGLTFKANKVENDDAKGIVVRYLELGETALDFSASIMSSSGYFERRLP